MIKITEHQEQSAFVKWAAYHEREYPMLENLFSIPNAGKRTKFQGHWLRDEGLKAGVPDLMLAYPSGEFHGLFIEMKVNGNKLTETQQKWRDRLKQSGYCYVVCQGFEDAVSSVLRYLML